MSNDLRQQVREIIQNMLFFFKPKRRRILLITSLLLTITCWVLLALVEKPQSYQWLILLLWLASLLSWLKLFSIGLFKEFFSSRIFNLNFLVVLILSSIIHFWALDTYPFYTLGDIVRDGGLDTLNLITGATENIFGYSRYQSNTYLFNFFVIPFHWIFNNSDLSFKVPCAIISILDTLILYYIGEKYFRRYTGLLAALILLCSPLHLFYGRTEISVIFSSLFASLLLLCLLAVYHNYSYRKVLITSLIIGISFNLYSATKPVAILTLGIMLILVLRHYLQQKKLPVFVITVASIFLFCVIGFGPSLKYTTLDIFINTKRVSLGQETDAGMEIKATGLYRNLSESYPQSLMVYVYEKRHGYYLDKTSLVPFSLSIFFISAIAQWTRQRREFLILIPFILLIPFSNSAATNIINADNRITLLLIYTSLAVAYGIITYVNTLKHLRTGEVLITLLFICIGLKLSYGVYDFFDKEYLHKYDNLTQNYMIMYTHDSLDKKVKQSKVCLNLSTYNYNIFDLQHYRENFYYYNPDIHVELNSNDNIVFDNEIYISSECQNSINREDYVEISKCTSYEKYVCPDDHKSIHIYLNKNII